MPGGDGESGADAPAACLLVDLDGHLPAAGQPPAEDEQPTVRRPHPHLVAALEGADHPGMFAVLDLAQFDPGVPGQRLRDRHQVDGVHRPSGAPHQGGQEARVHGGGQPVGRGGRQFGPYPLRVLGREDDRVRGEGHHSLVTGTGPVHHGHTAVRGREPALGRGGEYPSQFVAHRISPRSWVQASPP
jgi:hypothetical protein